MSPSEADISSISASDRDVPQENPCVPPTRLKRKASSQISNPRVRRLRRHPPESNSINGIIRANSRTRLFVPPILWKADQPRLLECHFVKRGRLPRRLTKTSQDESGTSVNLTLANQDLFHAAAQVCQLGLARFKIAALKEILYAQGFSAQEDNFIPFRFGRRIVDEVSTDGVFGLSASDIPKIAVVSLNTIRSLRKGQIYNRSRAAQRYNLPAWSLKKIQLRRLEPASETKDPYLVAILIALAQEQRSREQRSGLRELDSYPTGKSSTSYRVSLIFIPDMDLYKMYVYTADIHAHFLAKLDQPSKYSPSNPISILRYGVPLSNPHQLMQRLESLWGWL